MKRKKVVFITVSLFIILAIAFFLFHGSESPIGVLKHIPFSPQVRAKTTRLKLHPLTTGLARKEHAKHPVKTWEEWADRLTERSLGYLVQWTPELDTLEAIAKERAEIRKGWEPIIERGKSLQDSPPQPGEELSFGKLGDFLPMGIIPSKRHEGPQTTEALMVSFDADYRGAARLDEHYPRKEWIQMLLDKGVHFEDRNDYTQYLNMRDWIITASENLDWWSEGLGGVPSTDNFEDYKESIIRQRVFQRETFKSVKQSDPEMRSLMWFDDRPDKYLAMKGNRLYVNINPISLGTRMWGQLPTREESHNLIFNGVHPEGKEVIFVDRNYEVISEASVREAHDEYVRTHAKPYPPDTDDNFGAITPLDELDFMDEDVMGDTEGLGRGEFDIEEARKSAAREAFNEMVETEEVGFERFQDDIHQLEEFTNMSDVEIMAEIERQILNQFAPELPTDENIGKALETLDQHGFKEGFRRIKRDNPAVADILEQFFGQPSKRPPPRSKSIKPPSGKQPPPKDVP